MAKVRKVSVVNKGGKRFLKLTFVYYATKLFHEDKVQNEEVIITPDHELYDKIVGLRSGDEVKAIPATNEVVAAIPHNILFRWLLRNNGL